MLLKNTVGYDANGKLISIPATSRKLIDSVNSCAGRVKYRLGAKPRIDMAPLSILESDCSGFVRWIIHEATAGKVTMPDGSFNQQRWCVEQGFKPVAYKQSACRRDDRLRIAFIAPDHTGVGHVWLIFNAQTIECCADRGVVRRPYSCKALLFGVTSCFVLTDIIP